MVWLWLAGAIGAGCSAPLGRARDGTRPPDAAPARLLVLPDDGGRALVAAVALAQRRVWMEMYLLTDSGAVDALIAARAGGADVRVLLEPAPWGDETANQPAFAELSGAGVDVRWFSPPGGLVHAKTFLIDDVAWIATANLTESGLDRNREFAVADEAPADVARLEALWQADATGSPPPPLAVDAAASTRVVVAPLDARRRLTDAIDDARASLELEVEELSDPAVIDRLIAARARGVAVTIVVPGASDRAAATTAAASRLAAAGVAVQAASAPPLHAKAMTIDEARLYLGSVNLTRASLDDNREVGALLNDAALTARVRDVIRRDAAAGSPP